MYNYSGTDCVQARQKCHEMAHTAGPDGRRHAPLRQAGSLVLYTCVCACWKESCSGNWQVGYEGINTVPAAAVTTSNKSFQFLSDDHSGVDNGSINLANDAWSCRRQCHIWRLADTWAAGTSASYFFLPSIESCSHFRISGCQLGTAGYGSRRPA